MNTITKLTASIVLLITLALAFHGNDVFTSGSRILQQSILVVIVSSFCAYVMRAIWTGRVTSHKRTWPLLIASPTLGILGSLLKQEYLTSAAFCTAVAACDSFPRKAVRVQLPVVLMAILAVGPAVEQYVTEVSMTWVANLFCTLGYRYRLVSCFEWPFLVTAPGSVDVSPILFSPLGTSGLMAILAAAMSSYRRTTTRILLALPGAALAAFITQSCSLLLVLVAMRSDGNTPIVGLWPFLLLPLSALLLASTDMLVILLTSPIIPITGRGETSTFRNPLVRLWDRYPGGMSSQFTGSLAFFKPGHCQFRPELSLVGFIRDWTITRQLNLLPLASIIIVAASCIPLLHQRRLDYRPRIIGRCESLYEKAVRAGDEKSQQILLKSLASLTIPNSQWQLRLAGFTDPEQVDALAMMLCQQNQKLELNSSVMVRRQQLSALVERNPQDDVQRINFARLLLVTGDSAAAGDVIRSGLQLNESLLLREAAEEWKLIIPDDSPP
jgi:hypothetical protein